MTDEADMDDSITIPSQTDLSKFEDPALQKGLMAGPEDPNFSREYVNYHHWLAAQEARGAEHMAEDSHHEFFRCKSACAPHGRVFRCVLADFTL